jgi:negative regulator of sigma E activity
VHGSELLVVLRAFRARFRPAGSAACVSCTVITDLEPQNGAHRKPFPAATPSCKLTPRPHNNHEKRTAGST